MNVSYEQNDTATEAIQTFEKSGIKPKNDIEIIEAAKTAGYKNNQIAEILNPLREHFGVKQ